MNWFDQAYVGMRTELKDLNELNYARFEAKLEQRLSELRASLREHVAALEVKLTDRMAGVERRIDSEIAHVRADVLTLKNLIKWLFGFWAASTVTILAAIIRLAGS